MRMSILFAPSVISSLTTISKVDVFYIIYKTSFCFLEQFLSAVSLLSKSQLHQSHLGLHFLFPPPMMRTRGGSSTDTSHVRLSINQAYEHTHSGALDGELEEDQDARAF